VCIVSAENLKCIFLLISFVLLGDRDDSSVVSMIKDLHVAQEYPVILLLGTAVTGHGRRAKLSLISPPHGAVT
jgi:hypothetical protein